MGFGKASRLSSSSSLSSGRHLPLSFVWRRVILPSAPRPLNARKLLLVEGVGELPSSSDLRWAALDEYSFGLKTAGIYMGRVRWAWWDMGEVAVGEPLFDVLSGEICCEAGSASAGAGESEFILRG